MDFVSTMPVVGGYFDHSDEDAMDQLRRNQSMFENINMPDLQNYTPEELKYLGDYSPEAAQYGQVSEDPRLKSAQMSALNKMAGLADSGLSAEDQLGFQKAREQGAQMARSGTEAALQNAKARGIGGSGLEFAMREQAGQGGAQRSQMGALETAAAAARQRALYNQAFGDMAGQVRGQDYNVNAKNTDIINQFNQANTQNRNTAQLRNLDNRQGVVNQNVGNRNQAQLQNNEYRQQQFNNQMTKARGVAGANDEMAQAYYAQGAANKDKRKQTGAAAGAIVGGIFGGPMGGSMGSQVGGATA